jgi:hypothetical protein
MYLRDVLRQSNDVPNLRRQIPSFRRQFLVQYGIGTDEHNHEQPHQDQVHVLRSLSSFLPSSSEIEPTTQTGSNAPSELNNDHSLQHDDSEIPAGDTSSSWAPTHDAANNIENDMFSIWDPADHAPNDLGIENNIFDFSAFEQNVLESTSTSNSYEVL